MLKTKSLKKTATFILAAVLVVCMALPVFAEDFAGNVDSEVVYTADGKLTGVQNDVFEDQISQYLEPGDTATFTLTLRNSNADSADFWMDRRTIDSLEVFGNDTQMIGGGYTYNLYYNGPSGKRTLYESRKIDGSNFQSNDVAEMVEKKFDKDSYIFLDTFTSGATATITLEVTLDGETQGNDYQDTRADLAMEFAVEKTPKQTTPGKKTPGSYVRTGDTTNMLPFFIAMVAAGLIILVIAIYVVVKRKKRREEKA